VGEVLAVTALVLLVWLVLTTVAVIAAVVWMRRANRVVPGVRGTAPVTWLVSPSRPARLHRQLRTIGRWATAPADRTHAELWEDLLRELVATDRRVVAAARANPRVRMSRLDEVAQQVDRLDEIAARLRQIDEARTWPSEATTATSDALEVLERRMGNIEQAHRDLLDMERRFHAPAADSE
jgi:hypothetical protein